MPTLKSIKLYFLSKIYPNRYLSPGLTTLLTVHSIFLIGVGLSNTFINIFLWKANQNLSTVALFNGISFFTGPIVFMLGGWIAKKLSLTFNLRLGIVCYSFIYILLLILKEQAANYVWFLGILIGISGGFYYISYNVLIYDFSTNENRDYVMGVQGLVIAATSMIAPLIAGIIIEAQQGIKGYLMIFSCSFILFAIAAVHSTKIPIKMIASNKYYMKSLFFMPIKKKNWRYTMIGESVRGFREGVMMFLIGILIYSIVSSEANVGYYTLICSVVQLLSFYYTSQRITPDTRKIYLLFGSVGMAVVSSIFLFQVNLSAVYIYGILSSLLITFINNPAASMIYWVINKIPNSPKRRIEGMVVRELYLNLGRVAGILLLLMVEHNLKSISWIIFVLGLSQLLVWYFFNKVEVPRSVEEVEVPRSVEV